MRNIEKYKKELMRGVNVCKIEKIVTEITGKKICPTGVDNCNCCKELIYEWLLSECKEPILDDVERKYLSDVIKPFGHRVSYIVKRLNGSGYYIAIILNNFDVMNLPYFTRNTMYKGMKVGRQYKLKELGL